MAKEILRLSNTQFVEYHWQGPDGTHNINICCRELVRYDVGMRDDTLKEVCRIARSMNLEVGWYSKQTVPKKFWSYLLDVKVNL